MSIECVIALLVGLFVGVIGGSILGWMIARAGYHVRVLVLMDSLGLYVDELQPHQPKDQPS